MCVQGRGLGRMFLRHLRRTRIILHVVDAATGVQASPPFSKLRSASKVWGNVHSKALLTCLAALSESL